MTPTPKSGWEEQIPGKKKSLSLAASKTDCPCLASIPLLSIKNIKFFSSIITPPRYQFDPLLLSIGQMREMYYNITNLGVTDKLKNFMSGKYIEGVTGPF